jgi:hypothetical protein
MTVTAMRQSLADFDESRNRCPTQAFDNVMNVERPLATRANGSTSYIASSNDLPPSQAGLAAALRRAFATPCDDTGRKFEELLSRLG